MLTTADLDRLATPSLAVRNCRVCGLPATQFDVVDFNKFCSQGDFYRLGFSGVMVTYYRCRTCGCIFTDFFDGWDAARFSRYVYNAGYHTVDADYASVRPAFLAADMADRWGDCRGARVLDYGSGAGVFGAELARLGYRDVQGYDPFSSPKRPTGTFDIVTCFEVIEHSPDPVVTLREMASLLKRDGCIIVGQTLQPPDIDQIRGNWWYIAPRNGHICTYTAESLALLAQSAGLTLHLGPGPYGMSRKRLSTYARRALSTLGQPHYAAVLNAPGQDKRWRLWPPAGWHKLETGSRGPFRWSSSRSLTFPAPQVVHAPATLRVYLPVLDQIAPGLLEGITARCGGPEAAFEYGGDNLVADLRVRTATDAITVRTPRTIRPSTLRPVDDHRKLGLAIPAARPAS